MLIIDDDESVRWLLAEILADRPGWSITTASSGLEALVSLDAQRPDLILLDIKMPGLDGFDVYKLIRERDDLASVPVLFTTVLGDAQTAAQVAGLAGLHRLFYMPFDLDAFDSVIDDMLAKG